MRYKCKVPSFPVPRVKKREHPEAIAAKKSDAARGNLALVCLWACSRLRIWAWTFFRLLDQHLFSLHTYVLSLRYAFRFINRGMRKGKKNRSGLLFEGDDVLCWQPAQYPFLQLGEIERPSPFPPPCEPEIQFCSSQFWSLIFFSPIMGLLSFLSRSTAASKGPKTNTKSSNIKKERPAGCCPRNSY